MTKLFEVISTTLENAKHPFRQVDARPDKPRKHRYERRKVRECLRNGEWSVNSSS